MSLQGCTLALTKGGRCLFSGLTFTVQAGGALRILGANGAGKTSLLRLLCGLSRPDDGEVLWHGRNIQGIRAQFCAGLVYAGHADAVKNDLLAWENVFFGDLLHTAEQKQLACQSLALMGLSEQAELPVRALSQGQRKRVALARLHLADKHALWVLDEPFSSLDGVAAAHLCTLFAAHCSRGGMLVYTSHQEDALAGAATLELGLGAEGRC